MDGWSARRFRRSALPGCALRAGPRRDLGARAESKLVTDVVDVRVDGPLPDAQAIGDLPVGETLDDELDDLDLAGRERGSSIALGCRHVRLRTDRVRDGMLDRHAAPFVLPGERPGPHGTPRLHH